MVNNANLHKALKSAPRARFHLCDLHVHSPASPDFNGSNGIDAVSHDEKKLLEGIDKSLADQPVPYEQNTLSAFPVESYHSLLSSHRDKIAKQESISPGEDWALIAITDHNVCDYACTLSLFAWEKHREARLLILPGIELDVLFPFEDEKEAQAHMVLIYAPGTQPSDIRVAIHDLTTNNWSFGDAAKVSSLPDFVKKVRNHREYPALAIAAHVASSKGVREEARKKREEKKFTALEAEIARVSAEMEQNPDADRTALNVILNQLKKDLQEEVQQISVEVLKLVGSCGFDGLQVACKQDEIHYRRLHRFDPSFGRAVPLVASDAHSINEVFVCDGNIPYLKLPIQSAIASKEQALSCLRRAIRYGETRFSYSNPGQVSRWISGIEISPEAEGASCFWPFTTDPQQRKSFVLPFSKNLNCLIGGRGSGKSAIIEAIAFVTNPASFQDKYRRRDEELEDWYKRARATLSGCQVRLVWQLMDDTTNLPKGALFASRYFNNSGEYTAVDYTSFDNKELLRSTLSLEHPQIFRARDIENAAEPGQLRQLFDQLVGEQLIKVESDITEIMNQLSKQRSDMVEIARSITELTRDHAPLREYCRRKAAYEAANRPDVQPSYTYLDETGSAYAIAQDLKKHWAQAVVDADSDAARAELITVLDNSSKKIRDENGGLKPFCEGIERLFLKEEDGLSPKDRLEHSIIKLEQQIRTVNDLVASAVSETAAKNKEAREILAEQGLPAGAKDREAKKQEFEKADEDFNIYMELLKQWQDLLQVRNSLFEKLVDKCKKRTQMRVETAEKLCNELDRGLDPSVLVIQIKVNAMEDHSAFREWLYDNISPSIPKSKDARISGIIENGVMPVYSDLFEH